LNPRVASGVTEDVTPPTAGQGRPDVFLSYAREDKDFAECRLTKALAARGKDVWIDVEDIRGGAADWRANVWAGIESATVIVFVLTPDSLASKVCGEELQRAVELNKRIIPVLRREVDDLTVPPALGKPNWVYGREQDDFDASVNSLVDAIELDEPWVERHARLAQRTGEWLRNDRDGSYLLRGSDLRTAERWLDDQGAHREAPTTDQITYITASRRAAARRQRTLLAGVALALLLTGVLAVVALHQRGTAIDREKTARAQARAAQSIAALSRDPEASVRDALEAVDIRATDPEARYALRRAVSTAGWTSILRIDESRGAALLDAEFSDDGRLVASAAEDGRVGVWTVPAGRRVALVRHRLGVNTVQFSPDGRRLLTAAKDGTARIWDSESGRELHVLDTNSKEVWAATYAADGRRIMTASPRGAQVWDTASGVQIARLKNEGGYQGTMRLSLDGRRALTSADVSGDAWLWSVAGPRRIATLRTTGHGPLAFALFSADGRRVATLAEDGALGVWDGTRKIADFGPRGGAFYDADLSRDGRRVLRADRDGDVEVWDVASRRRIAVLPHRAAAVGSAQFDRSGEHVVTGDDDGVARVWQVRPVRRVSERVGHTAGIRRARFSPDGKRVVTAADDGSARLWPAGPRTPRAPGWQRAASTAFSPNSRDTLVVEGWRAAVWNTDTGAVLPLHGGFYMTDSLTWPCDRAAGCSPWSPDGDFVAGADADGGAVMWDARTGLVARRFGKATGTVSGAAFSPDGRRLVSVDGARRTARIWNVATGAPEAEAPAGGAARTELESAQFVARPARVLTVDVGGHAQLFDPATKRTVPLRGETVTPAVASSSDGRQLAIGTTAGELRVFAGPRVAMRSRRTTFEVVNSVQFSRAGTAIATGGQKGAIRTWDTRTLTPTPLRAPGGEVTGATFSGGGDLLLVTTGSSARLWDRTLSRVILELPQTPGVRAEFSPDSSRIVIAGKTRLEVLRCDACAPVAALKRRAQSLLPPP
jgi:WD40 repeat protein